MTMMDVPVSPAATVGQLEKPESAFSTAANAKGLSRALILETTSQCLREQGYDATTIRRIAGMLSCAVGSIYRYYKDKHELLFDAAQSRLEPAAEAIEAGVIWQQAVQQYIAIAQQEPEVYRLLFWLACQGCTNFEPGDAAQQPALPGVVQRFVAGWSDQVGDPAGGLRAWAMLHGCLMAGLDAGTCLASVSQMISALPSGPAAWKPPGNPQIVTVLKEPPMPRREPRPVRLITDDTEDVCLL